MPLTLRVQLPHMYMYIYIYTYIYIHIYMYLSFSVHIYIYICPCIPVKLFWGSASLSLRVPLKSSGLMGCRAYGQGMNGG